MTYKDTLKSVVFMPVVDTVMSAYNLGNFELSRFGKILDDTIQKTVDLHSGTVAGYQERYDSIVVSDEFERDTSDDVRTLLEASYMVPEDHKIINNMIRRACAAYSIDNAHAQRLYNYFSKRWFMFASPILSNGGTKRGLPISCYLPFVADSRSGILEHLAEVAMLSSEGGGVGGSWGALRSKDQKTSRGSASSGIIPFIKMADSTICAFHQGGTRRGAYATYLPISHPEIEEYLVIRKPTGGDPNRKALNIHNAVVICDRFMETLERCMNDNTASDDFDLIDPHSGEVVKTVSAISLFQNLLTCCHETGEPYIMYEGNVNNALKEWMKKFPVVQSNLCVSGDTLVTVRDENGETDLRRVDSLVGKQFTAIVNGTDHASTNVGFWSNGVKQIVEVKTKLGLTLRCTPDHKILACRNGVNVWVSAQDLTTDDEVVTETWRRSTDYVDHVKPCGEAEVYDCTIPTASCFWANGLIAHNCSEILEFTSEKFTAVCALSSVNLAKFDDWKDDEEFVYDVLLMINIAMNYFIVEALSNPSLHNAVRGAFFERSTGLGAMGFHDFLQSKGVPFESALSRSWTFNMFGTLQDHVENAQVKMSKQGLPKSVMVSAYEQVNKCKVDRVNAQSTAIAPNAKSSILCNTSPGIEPIASNLFLRGDGSGTTVNKNKHLEKRLQELGMDNSETWRSINEHKGSVQHLDIPQEDKDVFKTAREINQHWVIQLAADRTPFIDQACSVNLFFEGTVDFEYAFRLRFDAWKKGVKTLYYTRGEAARSGETTNSKIKLVAPEPTDCFGCDG